MDDEQFKELVAAGIDLLPAWVHERMKNVAVVIADAPDPAEHGAGVIFGFYEGVPQTERGVEYAELPDRITIFKHPILATYSDETDIRECVANTVWHEVAHHFGFDDPWIHREEERRGKTK